LLSSGLTREALARAVNAGVKKGASESKKQKAVKAAKKAVEEAIGYSSSASRGFTISMTFKNDLDHNTNRHEIFSGTWDWSVAASYTRSWTSNLALSLPGTGNSFSSKISLSLSNDYSKLFNTLMWITRRAKEKDAYDRCLKCLDDPLMTGKVFCKFAKHGSTTDRREGKLDVANRWQCAEPKQTFTVNTGLTNSGTKLSLGQMRKYTQERTEGPTDADYDLKNPIKATELRTELCGTYKYTETSSGQRKELKMDGEARHIIFDAFRCDKVQKNVEE